MEYSEELNQNFEDMQELEKKLESFGYSRSYCFGSSIPGKMTGCVYSNIETGVNVEINYRNKTIKFEHAVKNSFCFLGSGELSGREQYLDSFERDLSKFEEVTSLLL